MNPDPKTCISTSQPGWSNCMNCGCCWDDQDPCPTCFPRTAEAKVQKMMKHRWVWNRETGKLRLRWTRMPDYPSEEISVRNFDTGATRDTDEGKLDYEGFLSPLVLERYAMYMNTNRVQADGETRGSDNWQKGIPRTAYIKSAWRHFMDWWRFHRGLPRFETEDAICALLFNAMGYLHELLKEKPKPGQGIPVDDVHKYGARD